jgi:hypothetical protein
MCSVCDIGFFTASSASIICEPCPLGMVGHVMGGCRACSPGSYRDKTSSNCLVCEAGTYSGHGYLACIACEQGEYSNGVGSAECRPCASGSFSKKQSSYCTPCNINSATNLSKQLACPVCLSGQVAPFAGMTQCFPCPDTQNLSAWMSIVDKFTANASESDTLEAAAIIHSSCFQIMGTRTNSNPDNDSSSNTTEIAIISTAAGILLMLGVYFLRKYCTKTTHAEVSKPDDKFSEISVPISEMPENIRSKIMVVLGGRYFHQLIQGRQLVTETNPLDHEFCSIDHDPGMLPNDTIAPQLAAMVTIPQFPEETQVRSEGINDAIETPRQSPEVTPKNRLTVEHEVCCLHLASFLRIPLAETEEQETTEDTVDAGKPVAQTLEHKGDCEEIQSHKLHDQQRPSAQPQQYHGKKYSIDLENVSW